MTGNAWRHLALILSMPLALGAAHAAQLDCRAPREATSVVALQLGGVPALVRIPPSTSKPPIILLHGFGAPDSEADLMQALPLDEVAAIKIYLGLPLFGERAPAGGIPEFIERQSRDMAFEIFEPVVLGAAAELSIVKTALVDGGCVRQDQAIGLFGFSAGGASVLYALAERAVPIRAAVTLNASTGLTASMEAFERATGRTYPRSEKSRALALRSDASARAADIAAGDTPTALLMIHGGRDTMLPPSIAAKLHEALRPFYARRRSESRLMLRIDPELAHDWSRGPQVESLRGAVAGFFNQHL